ncbi:hypothetical protein EC973_009241 [Apophysomyces ossiformis]|uniref:Uncharacterized protein n=1 Tax=Apophysomyces ossiformis TaxID=679940 RepID=A0A8H7EPN5_9FUNG|nr:hypothetical protein EC973_009241 [Apophysomyces ossiformis]
MADDDELEDIDDFLDNDFFTPGVVEALDQQESQYLSSQRQAQFTDPAAPSPSITHDSPTEPSLAPPVVIRDQGQDPPWERLAWEPPRSAAGSQSMEEQQIASLRHTMERFQMELSQEKTTKIDALRETERLRIELSLKNQEIESLQLQLKDALKAKRRSTPPFSPRAQTASIPDPAPYVPPIQSPFPPSQERSSQARNPFTQLDPSKHFAFPDITSTGFPTRKTPAPVRPREKRGREEERSIRKPPKEVSAKSIQARKPLSNLSAKDAETATFLRRVFGKMFFTVIDKDASLDEINAKLLSRDVLSHLSRKLARQLMPAPQTADTCKKIAMLESDFVKCLEQSPNTHINSIIHQILDTIGLSFTIYREQEMVSVLRDNIQIIRTLAEFYGNVPIYLLQQFRRVEEISLLWNLVASLSLFPVLNADEDLDKLPLAEMDFSKISYQELVRFLRTYKIDPARLHAAINRKIPYADSVHAVNQILDIIIQVLRSASSDKNALESCVKILDHEGFLHLFSSEIPLAILSKAIMVLNHLLDSDSCITRFVAKNNCGFSILHDIQKLMMAKDETAALTDPEWYRTRIMLLTLYNEVITSNSTQVDVIQDVFIQLFPAMLQMVNAECRKIRDSDKPPYIAIPAQSARTVVVDCLGHILNTLNIYPQILLVYDGDMYDFVAEAVELIARVVGQEAWGKFQQDCISVSRRLRWTGDGFSSTAGGKVEGPGAALVSLRSAGSS